MRWYNIRRYALMLLLGLFLLLALLLGGMMTQSGLHLALNAAARWVPGLEIGRVEGGWRDLTLRDVGYRMPGVDVAVGQFHLSLDISCLKRSELCLNVLSAQRVRVNVDTQALPPSEPQATPSAPLGRLSTPYPLVLRLLRLNDVQVTVDGTAITLDALRSGAEWRGSQLRLQPSDIQGLRVSLPPSPAASSSAESAAPTIPSTPLGETLTALFSRPLLPAAMRLDLPLDLQVSRISARQVQIRAATDLDITSLELRAALDQQRLALHTLKVQAQQGSLSARGSATFSGRWPLDLQLNASVNQAPLKGEKLRLALKGAMYDTLALDANLSGPLRATLKGDTRLADAGLPLSLSLDSPCLRWPLGGTPDYQVNNMALRLTGSAHDYRLQLRGAFSGQGLPDAALDLAGKGNERQFTLSQLQLATLGGKADMQALVDWSKAISWRSSLTLTGIDTGRQWPAWPSSLNGKIETRGSLYGGSWQLQVPQLKLTGRIKQNALDVGGQLRGNQAGQWQIPQLHIALGRNRIEVNGDLAQKQWSLDARIDAPRLDGTLPGLAGTARGTLKLRGDRQAPQLLADLQARGLRWQALTIQRVALLGDIRSDQQIQGSLDLRVDSLKQGDIDISQLTLRAAGNERKHRLQLVMQGTPLAGRLTLNGSLAQDRARWSGTLTDTDFTTPVGEWRLTRPIALDYGVDKQQMAIGPHCWENPNARLCVPQTIEVGESGNVSVVLERFDLAMLQPFLGPDTQLHGRFSGRAQARWQAGEGLPQARITLSGDGVKLAQQVQGNTLPVALSTVTLEASLAQGQARLNWLIGIEGNGQLRGDVRVANLQGARNLSGNVDIQRLSLALLNPALMKGEKAQGMLNASLRLGGTTLHPQLYGRLALDGVDIDGQFMPFDVTDANLAINFDGMSSVLQGVIKTSQGQLNLSGNADWRNMNAWRARIAASGTRLRVTVPPMVRLDVSPNIVFDASPSQLALSGRVDIPWARITVQDLPESAVGVSSDEVMLNNAHQPIRPVSASIPLHTDLTIAIGNNVRLSAFGLKAALKGELKVSQNQNGLGLNGQIMIPQGRFAAYGQDLLIRQGELVFAGPPGNPLLNIEAIRNPESTANDVTVGVRVTGLAEQPKLEVFSDPAMSQQEALSYLLRGQGLDSSGADSNAMTSMLIGLGVAQSGKLVGKIGETFGVSNLTLDSQGVGDSSQVVVSGYVLPGLQVKYGVGIFDSLATLTLRYRLMPNLYLEAVSGVNQALDLLYQFEF
ncbi:autotransporter assembly complex protein TamB [Edwardsiella piscicida]|uniref:autotransporter assembly complex protein TamB n=1 Tax=Edwardsiella piscicida TaxID=1263550 RepID=UPI00084CBE8C|nr:translocation/assembly module TamB domain-containing protein [Edwardsiella piscicida]EKS7766846.1 translocation/assembly module TamB [Edwardsiella piscicida]EKS7813505.1 translocation/assembly module TamB [Edwardsiella piscicida]UCQ21464.1 translocation/assembly module TamB [Edwardsiella piscicida]WAM45047.1 translocation/assembly module TamB [Edwardsiella piscicida]